MNCCICNSICNPVPQSVTPLLPIHMRQPLQTSLLQMHGYRMICGACYEKNKREKNKPSNDAASSSNSTKEMKERTAYLSGLTAAFRDQFPTDIQVKPGNDGPSIPAHRALLAATSCKLRNTMDSAPTNQTITLHELNHEEVECLLEFLYSGSLSKEKLEKYFCSLMIAAHKYEIPFLQKFCEHHMVGLLNLTNALDILEISDTCSNQNLKETAINFIGRNMKDIVLSKRFEEILRKNPDLTLRITRAPFTDTRKKPRTGV